jgi:hypothetical protein
MYYLVIPFVVLRSTFHAAELRFMSASGRFMHPLVRFMRQSPFNLLFDHLPCTIDVLFGYFHSNDSIYKKAIIRLLE